MSEIKLVVIRHGRFFIPALMLLLVISIIKMCIDTLLVQQIYSISLILIFSGMSVYALDYLITLVGVNKDYLMLSSPMSRFITAQINCSVLTLYLALGGAIVALTSKSTNLVQVDLAVFVQYIFSVLSSLYLMLCIVVLLKKIRSSMAYRIGAWMCFIIVICILAALVISNISLISSSENWLIGSTTLSSGSVIYTSALPIVLFDPINPVHLTITFALYNAALFAGCFCLSCVLMRRPCDYVSLS